MRIKIILLIVFLVISNSCYATPYRYGNMYLDLPDGWDAIIPEERSHKPPLLTLRKIIGSDIGVITIGFPANIRIKDFSIIPDKKTGDVLAGNLMTIFRGNNLIWNNDFRHEWLLWQTYNNLPCLKMTQSYHDPTVNIDGGTLAMIFCKDFKVYAFSLQATGKDNKSAHKFGLDFGKMVSSFRIN